MLTQSHCRTWYAVNVIYIAHKAKTIHILKCAGCKSYDLDLYQIPGSDTDYKYECKGCNASGIVTIKDGLNLESFVTMEEVQSRADELKCIMSFFPIKTI